MSDDTKSVDGKGIFRVGLVLPDKHPEDPLLYKVYFGNKTANSDGSIQGGIWCTNSIQPFTRFLDINNTPISYGSYTPLMPWTPVKVSFACGGRSMPDIVGFAKTNTSIPDPENRDELHIIHKSPRGSMIAVDDKNGTIQISHNKGETSLVLSDDKISMEVSNGSKSGKEADSFFSISRGSFIMKTKDSMLKFDESGFFIGNDGDGSYFKVTKDGLELHGNETIKFTAKESLALMAKEVTVEGTKDMSLRSNHLRVSGTQLLTLTGGHIGAEAIYSLQLRGMHIGTKAEVLHSVDTPIRVSRIPVYDIKDVGVYTEKSSVHTVKTNTWALDSSLIAADGLIITNSGKGKSLANANYAAGKASSNRLEKGLEFLTLMETAKEGTIAASNRILVDTLGGTAKASQEATGVKSNAYDKSDTKTINSVLATARSKIESAMESVSVVPNLVAMSQTSLYRGNALGSSKGSNLNISGATGSGLKIKSNNSTFA